MMRNIIHHIITDFLPPHSTPSVDDNDKVFRVIFGDFMFLFFTEVKFRFYGISRSIKVNFISFKSRRKERLEITARFPIILAFYYTVPSFFHSSLADQFVVATTYHTIIELWKIKTFESNNAQFVTIAAYVKNTNLIRWLSEKKNCSLSIYYLMTSIGSQWRKYH